MYRSIRAKSSNYTSVYFIQCSVLNDKLDQLLHTLNVEEEAVQKPEESGQLSASGKPKV